MSMFAESMTFIDVMSNAVSKYRLMLRKYLSQADRMTQVQNLNLQNRLLYTNEVLLYELGYKIVAHLRSLTHPSNTTGYYTYSGIEQFANQLQKFLDKYQVDSKTERVMHISQLASRYMIKVAQILALSQDYEQHRAELEKCQQMLSVYASSEQIDLYQKTLHEVLESQAPNTEAHHFYTAAAKHFAKCLGEKQELSRVA